MREPVETASDEILDFLAHQLEHPLDCLRELVQNGVDAEAPWVDVHVHYTPSEHRLGVLEIQVIDQGSGMDPEIIDTKLTRLFSSGKEDAPTKIGRFGIGFVSVFALRPDAVQVLTGRGGSAWEVLFSADMSFTVTPMEGSFQGTRVRILKRMTSEDAQTRIEQARARLLRWCEHIQVPVSWVSRMSGREELHGISRPFDDGGMDLSVYIEDEGVEAYVGVATSPQFSFYKRGMMMFRTLDPTDLFPGHHQRYLHPLVVKVQSDQLETTLSRNGVRRGDDFDALVAVLLRGRVKLVQRLMKLAASEEGRAWQAHLDRIDGFSAYERLSHFARSLVR